MASCSLWSPRRLIGSKTTSMLSAPFIMTSPTTDWDHLRPLVRNRRPTGFIGEIKNLVPSCGPCNQSKGAADWKAWMTGKARGSPTTRGVKDVADRVCRLNSCPGEMSGRCYSRRWSRARCVVRLLGPAYHRYGRDVRSVQRLFAEAILPVFFPRREIGWKIAIGRRALPVNEFDLAHWASPRTKKDDDP
jgi:hypothetical protein